MIWCFSGKINEKQEKNENKTENDTNQSIFYLNEASKSE